MPKVSKKKLDEVIAAAGIDPSAAEALRQANDDAGNAATPQRHGAAHRQPIDIDDL